MYELLEESKLKGYEGVMLKNSLSQYSIDKRGRLWLKLKHATDTLVAAEYCQREQCSYQIIHLLLEM